MPGARRTAKKERKRVLREMMRIVTVVRGHAQRYHRLLDENWQATAWSRPQAEQVLKRIESVIEALPVAVKTTSNAPPAPVGLVGTAY
jgi:hypothetical protein